MIWQNLNFVMFSRSVREFFVIIGLTCQCYQIGIELCKDLFRVVQPNSTKHWPKLFTRSPIVLLDKNETIIIQSQCSKNLIKFSDFVVEKLIVFIKSLKIRENPSVPHIGSTQGPHLFSTENLSVPHQEPLSSTPKSPQFDTPFSSEEFLVWNLGVSGVEPRRFRCGTGGFFGWNWGVCWTEEFSVWKLAILGAEKEWPFWVELMCWTEGVWDWRGPFFHFFCRIGKLKMTWLMFWRKFVRFLNRSKIL